MERHLEQQYTHPPHIDVKYLKRCKSISGCPRNGKNNNKSSMNSGIGGSSNNNNNNNYTSIADLGSSEGRDNGGDLKETYRFRRDHSLLSPSFTQKTMTSEVYIRTHHQDDDDDDDHQYPIMAEMGDTQEFGEDLFHRHHCTISASSLSQFQQQVEHQAATEEPPHLTMPAHAYRGAGALNRGGLTEESIEIHDKSSSNHSGIQDQDFNEETTQSGYLDLPPPHPYSRPSISPMLKNPLSTASSLASSRVSSQSGSPVHRRPSPMEDFRAARRSSDDNEQPDGANSTLLAPLAQRLHHLHSPPEEQQQQQQDHD
ncbi:hypothetical protein BGZ65_001092 [Modicella reniformis]|uniref:Uncharacterized protein n=1 Tax=Modicella reniformis TaxID=1440133 RepID=A0A9P6SP11_9FUNG|nr:hypothetical protein BGZ65_001092 [Modicella reniformis]